MFTINRSAAQLVDWRSTNGLNNHRLKAVVNYRRMKEARPEPGFSLRQTGA
jgi:hypothetical protein